MKRILACTALALALSSGVAHADGEPFTGRLGTGFTTQGGNVVLTFLYSNAKFTDQLFVFGLLVPRVCDVSCGGAAIFNNRVTPGTTFTFDPRSLGIHPGDGVLFAICTNLPAGDGDRCGAFGNADALLYGGPVGFGSVSEPAHAVFTETCNAGPTICAAYTGGIVIGFEDIRTTNPEFPQDRDYNDLIFSIRDESTITPEPATSVLLVTGLLGVAGAARRPTRRTAE